MIYRRLYKTFQSLVKRRTESVTSTNHKLSVAVSHSYTKKYEPKASSLNAKGIKSETPTAMRGGE